jgi:hypothetical protein
MTGVYACDYLHGADIGFFSQTVRNGRRLYIFIVYTRRDGTLGFVDVPVPVNGKRVDLLKDIFDVLTNRSVQSLRLYGAHETVKRRGLLIGGRSFTIVKRVELYFAGCRVPWSRRLLRLLRGDSALIRPFAGQSYDDMITCSKPGCRQHTLPDNPHCYTCHKVTASDDEKDVYRAFASIGPYTSGPVAQRTIVHWVEFDPIRDTGEETSRSNTVSWGSTIVLEEDGFGL